MALYPLHLRLDRRAALVVGGGRVAERKIRLLLEAGARLRVVAPTATAAIQAWAAAGALAWAAAPFAEADVAGADLVFAAADDRAVNARVAAAARAAGAWVNVADAPEASDFHVPSVLRRGDLVVGHSTGGRAPGFAQAMRRRLDALLGPEVEAAMRLMAAVRIRARALRGGEAPKASYQWIVNDELLRACRDGDGAALDRMLRDVLGDAFALEALDLRGASAGPEGGPATPPVSGPLAPDEER